MSSQTADTSATKTASAKKPASKKPTVAGLAAELTALETRLKRADTKNRNALKKLDTIVSGLVDANTNKPSSQKAALSRDLKALEKKLTAQFEISHREARNGIREELSRVTMHGAGLETLEQSIAASQDRLNLYETSQRDTIARLNRHIADLAKAVDTRLLNESAAREAAVQALTHQVETTETQLSARIDQVEIETADALNRIGDKVAEFAAVLEDRSKQSDAETAERLADLAQETQSDFHYAQTDLTTRLEALETVAAEWSPTPSLTAANSDDPRVDHMEETLVQLQEELSRLHARLATLQERPLQTQNIGPISSKNYPPSPNNVVPLSQRSQPQLSSPYAEPVSVMQDENPYAGSVEQAAPSMKTTKHYTQPGANPAKPSHFPIEFDPRQFMPPAATPQQTFENLPPLQSAPQHVAQNEVQPLQHIPPMASTGGYPATAEPPSPQNFGDDILSAPMPAPTYENPAYAEDHEMRAERVGGDVSRKSGLATLGKRSISKQNLRVGALAVGVAIVGLFAANTILGGNPAPLQTVDRASEITPVQGSGVEGSEFGVVEAVDSQLIQPTPPVGNYAETTSPVIPASELKTLEAAVAAGNPIAQFQMGLSKLQSGEPEEAARLIRLAANRNQPAAQYRLAKLYETGTGVAEDNVTARELVERAALGGNRIAMHDLANYHFYGQGGLERDPAAALEWFTKAAERGVVDSQFNVAFLREGGQGIPEDLSVAYFWYNIAARQGDQGAPARILEIGNQLDDATRETIRADAARFTPKPVDEAANGVFRDVPWGAKPKTADNTARAARITKVRTAQTLLSDLGFDTGGADGAVGPKTSAAVREFQKINGLSETGEITEELIERLEIAAGV